MIRTTLKLISLNLNYIYELKLGTLAIGLMASSINKKFFREFRCPVDNKLLAKGYLHDVGSVLEAKCRACGKVSSFQGEDKDILKTRQVLLQEGKIPDTE